MVLGLRVRAWALHRRVQGSRGIGLWLIWGRPQGYAWVRGPTLSIHFVG